MAGLDRCYRGGRLDKNRIGETYDSAVVSRHAQILENAGGRDVICHGHASSVRRIKRRVDLEVISARLDGCAARCCDGVLQVGHVAGFMVADEVERGVVVVAVQANRRKVM